mmetsp:Transcript_24861/g.98716  ORF Transcript_24861/g.98716 Transcript_24861/m.98716 type:complete len:207 (+) Transcript_24861:113-733(+)
MKREGDVEVGRSAASERSLPIVTASTSVVHCQVERRRGNVGVVVVVVNRQGCSLLLLSRGVRVSETSATTEAATAAAGSRRIVVAVAFPRDAPRGTSPAEEDTISGTTSGSRHNTKGGAATTESSSRSLRVDASDDTVFIAAAASGEEDDAARAASVGKGRRRTDSGSSSWSLTRSAPWLSMRSASLARFLASSMPECGRPSKVMP